MITMQGAGRHRFAELVQHRPGCQPEYSSTASAPERRGRGAGAIGARQRGASPGLPPICMYMVMPSPSTSPATGAAAAEASFVRLSALIDAWPAVAPTWA